MRVPQTYADRFDLAVERGWEHAAFVDAYGPEHDRPNPGYRGSDALDYERGYADGWAEGVERFRNGLPPRLTQQVRRLEQRRRVVVLPFPTSSGQSSAPQTHTLITPGCFQAPRPSRSGAAPAARAT